MRKVEQHNAPFWSMGKPRLTAYPTAVARQSRIMSIALCFHLSLIYETTGRKSEGGPTLLGIERSCH